MQISRDGKTVPAAQPGEYMISGVQKNAEIKFSSLYGKNARHVVQSQFYKKIANKISKNNELTASKDWTNPKH